MIRKVATALAALLTILILPASASAAVNCNFNAGTGVVDITATNGSPFVTVERGTGAGSNNILVTAFAVPVPCAGGTPTVTTVDNINFNESGSNQGTTFHISVANGAFAPGIANEAGASDEIELSMAADATGTDRVAVTGGPGAETINFGPTAANTTSVNLNGAEADGIDLDVTATNLDGVGASAGGGDDEVTAHAGGHVSFTGPVAFDVSFNGQADNDTLIAGAGANNRLDGEDGNDELMGGVNADSLNPGLGDDVVNGGGGSSDVASYLNHTDGVTVDLRVAGPQNTVGAGTDTITDVDGAVGSNASDTLIGTDNPAGSDLLVGGQLGNDTGADVISGLAGNDLVSGGPGDDTLNGGAGNDNIIGAAGNDTVDYSTATGAVTISLDSAQTGVGQVTGGAGTDTLTDDQVTAGTDHLIENIIGSPFAGDVLTGSAADNVIRGYDGFADTVTCGGGAGDLAILDDVDLDVPDPACETSDNAPRTSISAGPADGATTDDTTPTYDLAADKPATFELSVDGGAFAPCADPCTTPVLALGPHTVAFRATDTDGNDNPELTPVQRAVNVAAPTTDPPKDTTPPQTTAKGPKAKTAKAKAKVTFSSSEPNSTFECRLDKAAYKPCASPFRKKVKVGKHKLLVRATDAAGNTDPTPAVVRWRRIEN